MYSISQLVALGVSLTVCATSVFYADYFTTLIPSRNPSLSVAEQHQMLASLLYHSSKNTGISANKNDGRAPPRLAFCCSADLDVAVSAVALMERVQAEKGEKMTENDPKFEKKGSKTLKKQHHERISSFQELQESFVYYFASGAAAEQSMVSMEQFREVVSLADEVPGVERKVGGNAATMAERAAAEGCVVLLGAAIGKEMKVYYRDARIQVVGGLEEEENQHEDVHLVLEYSSGDEFRGFISPRANRYYLNHDVHNARLSVLEEFEQSLDAFKPDLVVFGGLQLMEVEMDENVRLVRLTALSDVLQNLFVAQTPTHYEFAAVSDFSLFDDTVRLVLPWVESIGLNEQELFILHHYLVTGEEGTATTSRPTVAEISAQLHDVIQFASKAKENFRTSSHDKNNEEDKQATLALAQLSRIHFHTLQFHIVCQKKGSLWEDPTTALVQSALMSSKVACGKPAPPSDDDEPQLMRTSAEMEVDPERIEILLARQQLLSERQGIKVDLDPFSPVVTWQEADFQCHLVPMLACKKPNHTAGLGDNISGTGVSYHRIQKNNKAAN